MELISVYERMPPDNKYVLTFCADGPGYHDILSLSWLEDGPMWVARNGEPHDYTVTHWMPLPAVPVPFSPPKTSGNGT